MQQPARRRAIISRNTSGHTWSAMPRPGLLPGSASSSVRSASFRSIMSVLCAGVPWGIDQCNARSARLRSRCWIGKSDSPVLPIRLCRRWTGRRTSEDYEAAKSVLQGKTETNDFDVFLCYNQEDRATVKEVGEKLKEQGILPWLDEWELRPGLPWQRLLEQQIGRIKSAAVFIGKCGTGPWQQMELYAFLREFARRGCPVIPVILADAPGTPQLPIFLQEMTWVDFRKQDPDPVTRLIWGITGKKLF